MDPRGILREHEKPAGSATVDSKMSQETRLSCRGYRQHQTWGLSRKLFLLKGLHRYSGEGSGANQPTVGKKPLSLAARKVKLSLCN